MLIFDECPIVSSSGLYEYAIFHKNERKIHKRKIDKRRNLTLNMLIKIDKPFCFSICKSMNNQYMVLYFFKKVFKIIRGIEKYNDKKIVIYWDNAHW